MLTVQSLLLLVKGALARELQERNLYATEGAFEMAAPILPGDPEDACARVRCVSVEDARIQDGMLRFSLTDEALLSVLPDEATLFDMERAQKGLLGRLFAGETDARLEAMALVYARLCILSRREHTNIKLARELAWLSAKVLSGVPRAEERLARKLGPYIADLSASVPKGLRLCRIALGQALLNLENNAARSI
jgi:hypothetical protein